MMELSFLLFQLFTFGVAIVLLVALLPKKFGRVLGFLLVLPFTLQAAAIYANGRFIDARYLAHFSWEVLWQTRHVFIFEFGLFLLTYFSFFGITLWLSTRIKKQKSRVWKWSVPTFIIATLLMFWPNGIASSFGFYLKKTFGSSEMVAFNDALRTLGIPPNQYTKIEKLQAEPGKNIIVLSLESFEKGFLQEPYAELTPNIQALARNNTFFDMRQYVGSDWTAASVYSSISGMPTFFRSGGNSIFQKTERSEIVGLTHVLQKAGYTLEYLLGNPDFAGMGDMLSSLGFMVKSEKNFPNQHAQTDWGLHDYDLFNIAKQEVLELSKRQKPFGLFISSISTHPPNGILDNRVLEYVEDQNDPMKTMLAAVDYMVGDFIQFLSDNNLLENTVFYIMPDHQMIGNTTPIVNQLAAPRSLYLLSNANENLLSYKPNNELFQVMLPKLILEGAGVKHNAKFLYEFIGDNSIPHFLKNNYSALENLNEAAWKSKNYADGLRVSINDSGEVFLTSLGELDTVIELNLAADSAQLIVFDSKLRIVKNDLTDFTSAYRFTLGLSQFGLIIFKANNQLFVQMKKGELAAISRSNENVIEFTAKDIADLKRWPVPADYYKNEYNIEALSKEQKEWAIDRQKFIAHAGGVIDGHVYTNSLEALNYSYNRGFRMFELDMLKTIDNHFVAAHDWQAWANMTGYIGELPPNKETFLSYKLYDKYTPLSMGNINQWFQEHNDAILVTDKTNEPYNFSQQFIDPSRLMMELFSWDSVMIAEKLSLAEVLLSEPLLYEIEGDKLEHLKKFKVDALAMSRESVALYLDYYAFLKKEGIKIYLYHVNQQSGKNEFYVLQNELSSAQGMYADDWDFSQFEIQP